MRIDRVRLGIYLRWIATCTIEPRSISIGIDITIVTQVHLMSHLAISLGINDFIVTPVPRRSPITLLLVWHTVVDFLDEALEILEGFESILRRHGCLWRLIQVILARAQRCGEHQG
jgi:hypothetical protein